MDGIHPPPLVETGMAHTLLTTQLSFGYFGLHLLQDGPDLAVGNVFFYRTL